MEQELNKGIMQIDFQINEIMNKLMRQIKLTTDAATFLYHASINYTPKDFYPLQTDSLPIVIEDKSFDNSPDAVRQRSIDWIFKKAFEELIIGLTDSLIETYKFTKFLSLSSTTKEEHNLTLQEIEVRIKSIKTKPYKMNFPDLVKEIERETKAPLDLKVEIISINNLRNCLVHRNGIVTTLDTKNEPDHKLRLHYLDMMTFYEKESEMVEMKWEHKKNRLQTNAIQLAEASKTLEVNEGAHVLLDQNIFNGVAYTCITFSQKLYARIVIPHLDKIKIS